MGRQFDTDEWVDFFAGGHATEQTEAIGEDFSDYTRADACRGLKGVRGFSRSPSAQQPPPPHSPKGG